MDALHADLPVIPIDEYLDEAVLSQGPVILRNLVTLGKVRIEVVLSRPLRLQVDLAVQTQRCFHRHRDGYTIQDGQSSGQAKTHRARVDIRGFPELRRTRAEQLGIRQKLAVTLQPDYCFIIRVISDRGRGLKPATTFRSRHIPGVVAGFSPRPFPSE